VSLESDLLAAFEDHSPEHIRQLLAAGVSPTEPIDGKRPIDLLIEMYPRTSRFPECLQVMLDAGATTGDSLLEAVLLDDDASLRKLLAESGDSLHRKLSFVSAFTSCRRVTALHICADFNSVNCARVLLEKASTLTLVQSRLQKELEGKRPSFTQ
jgi:hypothetical protein